MLTNAAVEFAVFNVIRYSLPTQGAFAFHLLFNCSVEARLYTLGEHRQKLQENKSTW